MPKDEIYPGVSEWDRAVVSIYAGELTVDRGLFTRKAGYDLKDESEWRVNVDYFIEGRLLSGSLDECPLQRLTALRYLIDAVTIASPSVTLNFFDNMHPADYERLVADALADLGWTAQLTGGTGDQGIDIIASMRDKRIVVQCKRYGSPVGNSAVQQVFAGRAFARADMAVVVSSAGFTTSAVELAERTNVMLLHHDQLAQLQLGIFGTISPDSGPLPPTSLTRTARSRAEEILKVTPTNYEHTVACSLNRLGWKAGERPSNADDSEILAERNDIRVIVHCLGFISPINRSYIQDLMDARVVACANLAVLVSEQPIDDDARELAAISGVILLSHYNLAKLDSCFEDAVVFGKQSSSKTEDRQELTVVGKRTPWRLRQA